MSDLKSRYKAELLQEIGRNLDEYLSRDTITDFSADARAATASSALAGVREANRVNDQLGVFYSVDRVMQVLGGISRQAVNERVHKNRLLRVRTSDNVLVFPAFQFTEHGELRPGISDLLKILLPTGEDPWTVAYWLTSEIADFGGRTALDILDSRNVDEIEDLLDLARDDAAGWQDMPHGEIDDHARTAG
ncbi:DUF2384 domain-containing protein [Microbacterium sp. PRF11]|uniref:antitoxin Xre/MbcA/ParS toxin-binding domain-containing protein n=1 Tax=Microbacterium sp. PRF11 TaxID=2962593 RepID=UPI0028824D19|nr:antitoxin Xre/MbcA/ParS toxin-binding domain-containing protein [Microbacterium sp. PRF11]MDT0116614.1 DUF2384 domain-containing protein [Microbacterium sp. PRF11]